MTPSQATTPNTAVLLERIEQIRGDVAEIKASVSCFSSSQTTFEKSYIENHAAVKADVKTVSDTAARAHKRIDDLELQMKMLGDAVKPLVFQSKILAWAATVIGGAMILGTLSFLWAVATHQIVITTVAVP